MDVYNFMNTRLLQLAELQVVLLPTKLLRHTLCSKKPTDQPLLILFIPVG